MVVSHVTTHRIRIDHASRCVVCLAGNIQLQFQQDAAEPMMPARNAPGNVANPLYNAQWRAAVPGQ